MRTYNIDGHSVLVDPGWSIVSKINARSTLSLTVVDLQGLSGIHEGDSIEILDGVTKIFSGIVYSIRKYEEFPGGLFYDITSVDNSALADKRLIADKAENETAGDIITNRILPILTEEGVVAGDIATGPVIKKAVFNYIHCNEALDYIKDITGYNWNIDKDRRLNFFDRSQYLAPWTLDDTVQHSEFEQNSTLERYRNTQYVRAGKGRTNLQIKKRPTPDPDGVSRNFILPYPLAEKPTIYINDVPVNDSDIGVRGFDTNKKYYFAYDSDVIIQDESEPLLNSASGDKIEVSFIGLFPILVQAEEGSQITERKAKEPGTSGKYESLVKEPSIDENDQAIEFAKGLITKYGDISDIISFNTEVGGLEAGQLLPVNKSLFGINDNFLIESVTITPSGPDKIEYRVTALDGASLGGWEEFFKELIKGNREFVIAENEVLIRLVQFRDSVVCGDSMTVSSATPESKIGYAMIGFSEIA